MLWKSHVERFLNVIQDQGGGGEGEVWFQLLLSVFCPGFQKGRVPSEKVTLAR